MPKGRIERRAREIQKSCKRSYQHCLYLAVLEVYDELRANVGKDAAEEFLKAKRPAFESFVRKHRKTEGK